jgi:hypothetical protein
MSETKPMTSYEWLEQYNKMVKADPWARDGWSQSMRWRDIVTCHIITGSVKASKARPEELAHGGALRNLITKQIKAGLVEQVCEKPAMYQHKKVLEPHH